MLNCNPGTERCLWFLGLQYEWYNEVLLHLLLSVIKYFYVFSLLNCYHECFSYTDLRVFKNSHSIKVLFLSKLNHCSKKSQHLYFFYVSVKLLHHIFWNTVPLILFLLLCSTFLCFLMILHYGNFNKHDPTL